ncbi:sensor histidine kinase [Pedobacter sp. KACC 23697]|uniref:Histidine kinase n=1 Tax=Pedobacter sp. KACC 23697 TaxID=3149230 RepID=A0AAU7K1F3_9SPHI
MLYIFLGNLSEFINSPDTYEFGLADVIFSNLPNICTFYLSIWILGKYTNPLKTYRLLLAILFIYIFAFIQWYVTGYHIRPLIKASGDSTPIFNFSQHAISVLWVFIKYFFWGFGYHYASESIKHERKLRLIEKEKHEAEYAFLRAQINPHFLNNTLNFFFAKSLPLSQELADGIMTLSQIMRYSLEMDKDDRMTVIDEEIEHINNVIKINQLRFNNKLLIDFKVKGNTNNIRLIPLILITIVENILKHGSCTDQAHPVKIALSIDEINHKIQLSTWNKKKNGPKELSSGIGMENIKKRLRNHYNNDFALNITETELDYSLELILPFKATDSQEKPSSSDKLDFLTYFKLPQINPQPAPHD